MKNDDMPMWDDPAEPSYVHELLEAGRNAPSEYDAAQGLTTHLAHIQAGTPLPHWAQTGAGAGLSSGALVAWIALPVVTASIVAGLYFGADKPTHPTAAVDSTVQPAPIAPVPDAAHHDAVPSVSAPSVQLPAAVPTRSAATQLASPQSKLANARKAPRVVRAPEDRNSPVATKTLPEAPLTPSSARINPAMISATKSATNSAKRAPSGAHSALEAKTAEQAQATAAAEQAAQPGPAQRTELDESRLEREMQMLAVAQRVLSDDPDRALRMAQQGEREFPKTMFSAERQQVALLAMVKLGRIDDARRIGQPFLAKYPNAPWSARLRRALATGRVE